MTTSTCLVAEGYALNGGHVRIRGGPNHRRLAHHVAWEEASGAPVPEGKFVCHVCDTPGCIRNDDPGTYSVRGIDYPRYGHLWLGDNTSNRHDSVDKKRHAFGDRHGARLHPERRARGDKNGARLHPERIRKGTGHWRTTVTVEDVKEMRRMHSAGFTVATVWSDFKGKIGYEGVRKILYRITWKHIS